MSRKKKKPLKPYNTPDPSDWRFVISLMVVAIFSTWGWIKIIEQNPQVKRAQLLQVPELTEEIDTPQEEVHPVEEVPAENLPTPVQPSSILREIQIEGPVDSIVGDPVHLRVRADGPVVNYAWSITPDVDGLFVLDDGSAAIFTNRNAQSYTIYVSATDGLGNIEQDTHTFELVRQKDTLTLQNLSEANPDPSVPELLDYYVTEVPSVNKESEVIIVSQSFRQTANLLRTNAIGPGENVLGKVKKGLEVAMGPASFKVWNSTFFQRLETLLTEYASKGYLTTRDEWVNTLDNLASILETRSQRK